MILFIAGALSQTATTIASEVQKLAPSSIIELFEIDASVVGGDIYRFHSGKNQLIGDLVWQGNTYNAFPIEASGFEWNGKGQMPRPKVLVSNVLGTITALVLAYQDLIGCKFTRIRTLQKYLDAVNFGPPKNRLLSTDSLDGAWFRGTALTGVTDGVLDPFGGTKATQFNGLSGTSALTTGAVVFVGSVPITVGKRYTISVWLNPLTNGTFRIRYGATADIQTAAFPVTAGSGWQRVSATFLAGDAGGSAAVCLFGASGGAINVQLSRAQFEEGSEATDYMSVATTVSKNPDADPTAEFPRDVYYIDRKSGEDKDLVEFELASSLDLAGVALPRRQVVQNYCPWKYRGSECGYTGTNYFNTNDAPVATLALDVCGKRLSSCRARFGQYGELPYGGFPAAGLMKV
jgi:phage-related protein